MEADQPTAGVEIVLRRGRAFRGRVVDSAGRAVAGALVQVSSSATPGIGGTTVTSGPDGQFEFRVEGDTAVDFTAFASGLALVEHLAPGSYRVEVGGKAVTFDVREVEVADLRIVVEE